MTIAHRPRLTRLCLVLAAVGALQGCGQGPSEPAAGFEMPKFADPVLAEGRSVWMGTCRACHLMGAAGAPAVTNYPNWEPRIAKGVEALFKSPIHGIKGDDGKYKMPPRGGNERLTDRQIEAAVEYMVASVDYLHQQTLNP
ncbi:c-type cytochrome [Lamprobacter modestohalophilus]|uniref:c-type cytochrome n=1 Tax=Lamprobacter modestohalophilus TaxID=1064514 RepID=UPI002ADEEDCE|nr:c-type cytochrome [Lamprobacter modestohalophilus]MEA1052056.1 c-type cytochrome [Lamprobacter modestohalophilus]